MELLWALLLKELWSGLMVWPESSRFLQKEGAQNYSLPWNCKVFYFSLLPESVVETENKTWAEILHPYWEYVDKWDKSYRIAFSVTDFFCCAACNDVCDAVFHLKYTL